MSQPASAKARVIKILGRIGVSGILTEVQVQPLDFPKMHFRRSVKGRVRIGDIIDFVDTELAGQPSTRSHSNFGEIESALKCHFHLIKPAAAKARVIKILGRIGVSGILTEVQVQPLDFPKMHFRRSVKGRVRIGDIIDFVDTELAGQPSTRSHSNFGEIESALKCHFHDPKEGQAEK